METNNTEPRAYHRLDSVEEVDEFYQAIARERLTQKLSPERPYCYWTIETYDKSNGIRGGGGLGVLAADMRRVAEQLQVPFVLVTPFYPWESHQKMENMEQIDYHTEKNYEDFGFNFVDTAFQVNYPAFGLAEKEFNALAEFQVFLFCYPVFGHFMCECQKYSGDNAYHCQYQCRHYLILHASAPP